VDYDKDEILQKCIKAIEDHKCTTFDEMSLYVAPTRQTLYNWGFDKFDIIKEAICQQKIIAKSRMKKNWQSEEAAPALQIAAFKLMADDDELEKLVINKRRNESTRNKCKWLYRAKSYSGQR
jgi:hypothetical protein